MVCPSQNQTLTVLRQMLSQVAEVHPRSKRVHIGSDEVYQDMIGKCRQCRERMASRYWGNSDLFLSHVVNVATLVRDELKLQPLMWDDEFRSIAAGRDLDQVSQRLQLDLGGQRLQRRHRIRSSRHRH